MRHAELVLRPGRAGFHPADRALVDAPTVERVAIHHINQLDDDTIVFLYQLQGDLDRAREILTAHADVLTHSISRADRDLHAYIHFEPNEIVDALFRLPQEYSLVVDTPIECLSEGGIRVTALGDHETLTTAISLIPDAIDVELETMGDYHPDDRQLFSALTERQQEILLTAVDMGYYDVPREATYEDIAAALDLAPVTVGEHLRKIEARVLTEIVPG
ncbi:helix-turn-helix domain-containing protein [Halorientalis marina]|jgi:predicted DNA binding protein|uniref:helix-turn-helix domain-containing protein n=1 Tax=Halorientalis marina TaxID=2931976 RepID=UPI001FF21939|nr:helix-turn-helix domain-containing protein [Halorientalis marina]